MLKKLIIGAFLLAAVCFGGWSYGNSIENNDMSNSGLQVFGAMGAIFFFSIFIMLLIVKLVLFVRHQQPQKH
jgi:hypothetical protein